MADKSFELAWSLKAEVSGNTEGIGNYLHFAMTSNPSFDRNTVAQFRAIANEMERILDDQEYKAEFGSIIGAEGTD